MSRDSPPSFQPHWPNAANIASLLRGPAHGIATRFSNIGIVGRCIHAVISQHLSVPVAGAASSFEDECVARVDLCPVTAQGLDELDF